MTNNSIKPGKPWLDTQGKPIQAHGFSVFWNEAEKLWYWYGENKEKTVGGKKNTVWHWGVRLYTSPDLMNWTDRGLIIPPTPDDLTSPLHPTYCMDRPHILYCKKTGKYVAWLKIMGGEVSQFMSVLTADKFEGPYTFARKIYKPLDMDTGRVTGQGRQLTGKCYLCHPSTGRFMPGFQVPFWDQVTAMIRQAAVAVPHIGYVGWDVAITPEGPELVEGNINYPDPIVVQLDGRGVRRLVRTFTEGA